jgi:YHS domain-containing protein
MYNRRMSSSTRRLPVRSTRFVTLCGRIFRNTDPQYFPSAEYRGRTLYFCTDSCLAAFQADPERFYSAHRKSNHRPNPLAKQP